MIKKVFFNIKYYNTEKTDQDRTENKTNCMKTSRRVSDIHFI